MRRRGVVLCFVLCFVSVLHADIELSDLAGILDEQQERLTTLQADFTIDNSVVYQLNPKQIETEIVPTNGAFGIAVEKGKMFTSQAYANGEVPTTFKNAWNGETTFSSTTQGELSRNGRVRKYVGGPHSMAYTPLAELGIYTTQLLGVEDKKSDAAMAWLMSPGAAITRIAKTHDTERIALTDVTYDGRKCVLVSLSSHTDVWNGPIAEFILDPGLDFAWLETKLYDPNGLLRRTTLDWQRDDSGLPVIKKAKIEKTVRSYNRRGYRYPEDDNNTVAVVQEIVMNDYALNRPLDPVLFEADSVFVPGADTWDDDLGVNYSEEYRVADQYIEQAIDEAKGASHVPLAAAGSLEQSEGAAGSGKGAVEPTVPARDGSHGWVIGIGVSVFLLALIALWRSRKKAKVGLLIALSLGTCSRMSYGAGIDADAISLGIIPANKDIVECEYPIMNTLDKAMHIADIKKTCTCAVPEYPDVIEPRATYNMKIHVNSNNRVGRFAATLIVLFKEGVPAREIDIVGYKQSIRPSTQHIFFQTCDLDGELAGKPVILRKQFDVEVFEQASRVKDPEFLVNPRLVNIRCMAREDMPGDSFTDPNGVLWAHVKWSYSVEVFPRNIGPRAYTEYVRLMDPFEVNSDRPMTLSGRIYDMLYTIPSSLNYVGKTGDAGNLTKSFRVIAKPGVKYTLDYDKELLSIEKDGDQMRVTVDEKKVLSASNKKEALKVDIQYCQEEDKEHKSYTLPIKIIGL